MVGDDYDPQGTGFGKLIDKETLDGIYQDMKDRIWGWFTVIGDITSGFIGVYIIFRLVKYAANTIINIRTLYELYGGSIWIFSGVWSGLTSFLVHRHYYRKTGVPEEVKSNSNSDSVNISIGETDKQNESECSKIEEHQTHTPNIYPSLSVNSPYSYLPKRL